MSCGNSFLSVVVVGVVVPCDSTMANTHLACIFLIAEERGIAANALFCQTLIPFSLSCFDKGCYNARFVMPGPINLSEFFQPLIKKDEVGGLMNFREIKR